MKYGGKVLVVQKKPHWKFIQILKSEGFGIFMAPFIYLVLRNMFHATHVGIDSIFTYLFIIFLLEVYFV